MAPIVIKDIVITGISGGEFGVRGRVSAFDVAAGKHLWTGYSTGPDSEVLLEGDANANYPSHKGKDLGISTWQGDEWKRGGGTTWGWYTYDPELDLLYYSVGNPGSWDPDQRPGDQADAAGQDAQRDRRTQGGDMGRCGKGNAEDQVGLVQASARQHPARDKRAGV